ncbi:MAG TPA: BadF/BadG/BcrA/BcrD ATPase family protein [Solirubrobacteraceae bacterium]|nr:BadF/BadG/BcrA/BcrD ATPase family protein [Solirubrobacteraceae bacterium]
MTPAALAVDAGQTRIRAALGDGRGSRSATAPGVVRVGSSAGPEVIAERLLAAVAELGPLPEPAPPAAIGLSGFEAMGPEDLGLVADAFRGGLGLERLAIATDGLTALLGAIGPCDGVVVAAGTGTACLGRRGDRFAKVDGWGSLLSDAGSGFAIGRAGLDAALRAYDGRGGSPRLMDAASRRYGTIERVAERIYSDPVPTRAVAAFAADVAAEAQVGDEAARAILHDAARELAISACAASGRLFEPEEPVLVSYTGNVFQAAALIVEPFTREVEALRPGASVVPPSGDPLAGAFVLAELASDLRPERGILQTWT